jgi:hypothetical protein
MRKISYIKYAAFLLILTVSITSCIKDLDQTDPNNANKLSAEQFYANPASYKQALAKLYAGLATTGQEGPAGNPDISGIDEGESQYIRGLWVLQELTTDEAVIAWNDKTIKDFHWQTWTAGDLFINATFSRLDFQVKNCNEFLRQTTDEKLTARGVSAELKKKIKVFRAEARFLRAFSYWHFIDLFGNVGMVTEDSPTTFFLPEQATRKQLFDFVEAELKAIETDLVTPKTNEYPRIDKAASWMLLAKLYLNAKVYTNTEKYTEAFTAINKVIGSGYTTHTSYPELFLADNDRNGAQNGFIFSVAFDGLNTKTYGGTTFLTHAAVGGNMNPSSFGVNGGWFGTRTTSAFVNKFDNTNNDKRKQFHTNGQSLEIDDIGNFNHGYAITKWKNVDKNGLQGSDKGGDFVDTDFPVFRMADAYLMYAEIFKRNGGGDATTAVGYINKLRERAYGNTSGNINAANLTLDFILDERARELHWEGHRRTDLIRFGKFTGGSYVWPWKGKVAGGSATSAHRNLFPIPSNSLAANPKLKQNTGY